MKNLFLIFFFVAAISADGFSQRKDFFANMEDSIVKLHYSIISEHNSIIRNQKNEDLLLLIEETLRAKNSMAYSFDAIKTISVLTSKDKKVRIFTWFLTDDQNTHIYYGFLQTYSETEKEYRLFPLTDKWGKINNPEAQMLTPTNWYGAYYTEIIETESSTKKYYTLLGWNGGDIFSQCKLIEVLYISPKGVPSFGARIFQKYPNGRTLRVIFRYAKNSHFILRYDNQHYTKRSEKKDKKTNRYTTDTIPSGMIVFSQLIPMDESVQSVPQLMVGEASLNDAFIEKNGVWVFQPDVIVRNPIQNTEKREPKKVTPRRFYSPNK